MIIKSLRPDTKSMQMTLQEYCSWYFNKEELSDIFGLGESVLPSITEVLENAIIIEGYDQPSLYAIVCDDYVDKDELLKVAKELNID